MDERGCVPPLVKTEPARVGCVEVQRMDQSSRLKMPGRHMARDVYALYLAARHPDTPRYVKLLLASAVVYFISPIDLMPDLTPVFGYIDDLAVVPLIFMLAMSLVPAPLRDECRQRATTASQRGARTTRVAAMVALVAVLIVATGLVAMLVRAALT